ncbi:MAG: hypothetical protein HY819_18070 [Acidobacteria bacterium]|nr:hypothetical protein [Acidobacteriota bacterium]
MYKKLFYFSLLILTIFTITTNSLAQFNTGRNVEKLANFNPGSAPYSDVYFSDGRAYIGGYDNGKVHIVDVKDDQNIKLLGTYQPSISGAGILDLQARGNFLFCALSDVGFTIVDVSNPAKPQEIAVYSLNLPLGVHDLFVKDNFIYLCDNNFRDSKLHIVDISDLRRPKFVTTLKSNGGTHDLTVIDNIAYIANLSGGFRIADFTNPAKPIVLADHNYSGSFTHNIWPSEDKKTVFTTDETCGTGHLRAFDISDLKNIRQIGEYKVNDASDSIIHNAMVVGNFAYISYYKRGLRIVDVSDPKNMKEVGNFETWDGKSIFNSRCFEGAWGVFAEANGRVYISDISTGIWVFKFQLVQDNSPVGEILFPKGNEVFGQGEKVQIEWSASDDQGITNQELELSIDGGNTYSPIATNLNATARNFAFNLPNITTDKAKLRLIVEDGKNAAIKVESTGLFQIVADAPPSIKVLSPNGGETFSPNDMLIIKWKSSDDRRLVSQKVEFSLNGGTTYNSVAELTGEVQQFAFKLPALNSNQALVRISVSDGVNQIVSDTNDRVFQISDDRLPQVKILSPNGGEQFIVGQQIQVSWQSTDDKGLRSQSIEFSSNSGVTFTELAKVGGSVQNFTLNIPSVLSKVCRLRITVDDGNNPSVSSTSESDFAIFEFIPKVERLSLKSLNSDKLVIDLDPDSIHNHNRISPLHEGGEETVEGFIVEILIQDKFIAYSEQPKLNEKTGRLVTKGKLGNGLTTRQAFPEGQQVTVRIIDDHGAKTLVNVIRNGKDFQIK